MRETVRISRLRIATTGQRGVPMIESMVSNALRTQLGAAGALAGRGLLVVRKLDLGPIAARGDQARLNRTVAAALRGLAARALPFDDPRIDVAPAALFPDPLAPLSVVLQALGAARPIPRSWPFRAVFGEVLDLPAPALAAALLARAATEAFAFPALLALLDDLGPRRDAVVAGLPAGLADILCAALILPRTAERPSAPARPAPATAPQHPPSCAEGTSPAALRLLAAHALCTPQTPVRPVTPQAVEALMAAWRAQSNVPQRPSPGVAMTGATLGPRAPEALEAASPKMRTDGAFLTSGRHLFDPTPPGCPAPAGQLNAPGGAEGKGRRRARSQPKPAALPGDRSGHAKTAPLPEENLPEDTAQTAAPYSPPIWADGDLSPLGGLVCLISLMQAALGDWLRAPGHLAQATGAVLLGRMLARLAGDPRDPMLRALAAVTRPDPEPTAAPDAFWLPGELAATLPGTPGLHLVAGRPGWRALTLWRGRIVIALWSGRAPPPVRRLLRRLDRPLRREHPRPVDSTGLLEACELGLRRWLRTAAGLRPGTLAARPGHIAATRTHLDVTFDADLIELQTRRLGLDVSPGWCPWMARVVNIHYDFGGADA